MFVEVFESNSTKPTNAFISHKYFLSLVEYRKHLQSTCWTRKKETSLFFFQYLLVENLCRPRFFFRWVLFFRWFFPLQFTILRWLYLDCHNQLFLTLDLWASSFWSAWNTLQTFCLSKSVAITHFIEILYNKQ